MEAPSQGQELLHQHRSLLKFVDQMQSMLDADAREVSLDDRVFLRRVLRDFILELELHFSAEGAAIEADFSDRPELESALQALDAEHPELLRRFDDARKGLEGVSTWEYGARQLAAALEMFRHHEAREDALFRLE